MLAFRRVASTQRKAVANVLARSFSDEATNITLNFAMPHGALYENEEVELVRLTSCAGEYGVTAGHTPNVSQLAPGLAMVYKNKDDEPEKFFVSGEWPCLLSPNSRSVRSHVLFYCSMLTAVIAFCANVNRWICFHAPQLCA